MILAEYDSPIDKDRQQARVLPNLFIPGVMRAGTSMMFDALQHHPEIATGSQKEYAHFDFGMDQGKTHLDYGRNFPSMEILSRGIRYVVEATPSYIYRREAMHRIHAFDPDAHLIIMLRDPVERAISHFKWLKRFHGGVFPDEDLSRFRKVVNPLDRATYEHDIVARSMCDTQVGRVIDLFKNVLIIDHEEFMRLPLKTMEAVCAFLGMEWGGYWDVPNYGAEKEKLDRFDVSDEDRAWLKSRLTGSAQRLFRDVLPDFKPKWRGDYE